MEIKIVKESEVVKENNAVEECSTGRKVLGILIMVGMPFLFAFAFSNGMESTSDMVVGGCLGLSIGCSSYMMLTRGKANSSDIS